MSEKTPALRLGASVRFQDRWAGNVTAIEISDDWEIYNVAVRHGLFKAVTVRLPLEAATGWDDDHVAFDEMTSRAAFGREVPPVAAPSRPVSEETPIAGGGRLAGVLVSPSTRLAGEVLLERGGLLYRVPAEGVTFDGKTMYPGVQPDALIRYFTQDEMRERVRQALGRTTEISSSELQHIDVEVLGRWVGLTGNVRSKNSREAARRAASTALGVSVDSDGLADDLELETKVALALDGAGLTRAGEIYPRSTLGEVVLRGRVSTQGAAEDAGRVAARVAGVRRVTNRIAAGAPDSDAKPAGVGR